jgi:CBS domain-containing protein
MLQAKDIMSSPVITVNINMDLKELAKTLTDNGISGAPVIDNDGRIIGVVTENDLIDQRKKVHIPTVMAILDSFVFLESPTKLEKDIKKMAGTKVEDIYSKELSSVTPDTPLDELATLMAEQKIHTLPVMEGEQLLGVIGKTDIIRTLIED